MHEEREKDFVHYILQYMLSRHFKSKSRMAKALKVELRTIQKTFSQLEKNTSKGGSIVLEKILVYCAQNNISMDELVKSYKEKQKSIPIEKEYVNFPIPEDMIQSIADVYMTANEYVQCVASHLCPHCRKECHPKLNDKWLWNDCLVSRISMIMLSHIMLVQEKLEFHDMRV